MLYTVNDNDTDQDMMIKSLRHYQDFDSAQLWRSIWIKKLQQFPHKNSLNIVVAMMQVAPSFPAYCTLLYGQWSLSAELSEFQYYC